MKPFLEKPPLGKPAAGKPATGTAATAAATLARLRGDHLLLWTAYAAVPITWLAVALVAPALLLAVPLVALGLALCFRFGILERFPGAEDELDF